jgi:hypothetical protein
MKNPIALKLKSGESNYMVVSLHNVLLLSMNSDPRCVETVENGQREN